MRAKQVTVLRVSRALIRVTDIMKRSGFSDVAIASKESEACSYGRPT